MNYKHIWVIEKIASEKLEYGFTFQNKIHKDWELTGDKFFTKRKTAKTHIADNYSFPNHFEYRISKYMGPITSGRIKEI